MSWKDALKARKYDEHKHCTVCSRAIPIDRDFCSQECKDKFSKADKSKSRKNTIQLVVLGVAMVVMIVVVPLIFKQ